MTSRPKLFSEFLKGITVANTSNSGCKIICNLKQYVLVDCKFIPWNSKDTKRTFLSNLYIKEILMRVNLSKKIRRPGGYELLGARCLYRDQMLTVCGWQELADKETGEIVKQLTLAGRFGTPVPCKALITEVQL